MTVNTVQNEADESHYHGVALSLVRRLCASRRLVFKACTDPKWLIRWLVPGAGCVQSVIMDARRDGEFELNGTDPDGLPYHVCGTCLDVVRDERIVLTWQYQGAAADLNGPPTKVTIALRALGEDSCELTLTHTELPHAEAAAYQRMVWQICLERLAWSTDPATAHTYFRMPVGAISEIYGEHHRTLQDQFDSRQLANRLRKVSVGSELTADAREFIQARDMVFLSTVDHRGFPTCSYKGGAVGFVHVVDSRTLVLPSYDGNGMYLSAGNIAANPKVGLLFIDFERPHRLRIHGVASLVRDEHELKHFPGAELLITISIHEVFINCPRYIHHYERVGTSRFVPQEEGETPMALWKTLDLIRGYLPERDKKKLEAQALPSITRKAYLQQLKKGKT